MFLSAWCFHFPFSHLEYSLHWGGVFSTQILTRLHTWGLSNVSKHMYKIKINSREEGGGGGGASSFSPSAETGEGSTKVPSCTG